MKVMLDTNILISAFVFKSNKMNILMQNLTKNHEIIICSYVINELKGLMKDKFHLPLKALNEFLKNFSFTLVYSPEYIENKLFEIRDANDYIILHTAIVEDVDIFITGDKDFNNINIKKPLIMTATEFLEKYC